MGEHVVLVGLMGSGKTTVGRIVARRLGRPFVDSDAQVEAGAGRTVREIWVAEGEPAFRRLEAAALRAAVEAGEASVIAAAGGVVLDPGNRKLLRGAGAVVWLRGDAELLATRAERGEHRPLLDTDPVGTLRAMAAARQDLYREVADHVVPIDARSPDELAAEIIELVW
ncbi:MAG: shikimate kinase [Acidimicrobiales bacterium]